MVLLDWVLVGFIVYWVWILRILKILTILERVSRFYLFGYMVALDII